MIFGLRVVVFWGLGVGVGQLPGFFCLVCLFVCFVMIDSVLSLLGIRNFFGLNLFDCFVNFTLWIRIVWFCFVFGVFYVCLLCCLNVFSLVYVCVIRFFLYWLILICGLFGCLWIGIYNDDFGFMWWFVIVLVYLWALVW